MRKVKAIQRGDDIMLERIKDYVKKKVNRPVSTKELEAALDDAKNNITCNYLLLGHDVTAKDFMDTLVNCIRVNRVNKTPKEKAGITVIDQFDRKKKMSTTQRLKPVASLRKNL